MPQLSAALVPGPDRVVVRLTGDADLSTAPVVSDALGRAAALGTAQVLVDLGAAQFWDCSGLHALAAFSRNLTDAGRACRIVAAQPATRRLIGMANLAGTLQVDGVATSSAIRAPTAGGTPLRRVPRPAAPVAGGLMTAGR